MKEFSNSLKSIILRRELLWILVKRNLKIRYKNSVLGFFWTLLNPLFMMLIYLVFIKIMRFKISLGVLLTGIIPWQFLVMSLNDSLNSIAGHSNLIKKVYFPRLILPAGMIVANLINFLLSLGVLTLFLIILKGSLSTSLLLLPVLILLHLCLVSGFSLILSTSNVFFKDTEHLLGVALLAWFFVTPIIYPLSLVPERFMSLYVLNPLVGLTQLYRSLFLGTPMPSCMALASTCAMALGMLGLGLFLFYRYEPYFADEL